MRKTAEDHRMDELKVSSNFGFWITLKNETHSSPAFSAWGFVVPQLTNNFKRNAFQPLLFRSFPAFLRCANTFSIKTIFFSLLIDYLILPCFNFFLYFFKMQNTFQPLLVRSLPAFCNYLAVSFLKLIICIKATFFSGEGFALYIHFDTFMWNTFQPLSVRCLLAFHKIVISLAFISFNNLLHYKKYRNIQLPLFTKLPSY